MSAYKMKQICFVYFTVIFLSLACSSAYADTNAGGIISANTAWNLAGSPYIVTADVAVNKGITLTVEAGVKIKFNSGLNLSIWVTPLICKDLQSVSQDEYLPY